MKKKVTGLFCGFAFSAVSLAQTTPVEDKIGKNLVSRAMNAYFKNFRGKILSHQTTVDKLDFYLAEGGVMLDPGQTTKLPESIESQVFENVNCTDTLKGHIENYSKSITINRSVAFTKNISTSSTTQLNVNLSFPLAAQSGTIGGSAGTSSTRSISLTNASTWSETSVETRSRTIDMYIQPHSALYIKVNSVVSSIRMPFKGKVTIDGMVTIRFHKVRISAGVRATMRTFFKKYKLSELLSAEERTFELEGVVQDSKANELQTLYMQKNLTNEECARLYTNSTGGNPGMVDLVEPDSSGKSLTTKAKRDLQNALGELSPPDMVPSRLVSGSEVAGLPFNELVETEYFGSRTFTVCNCIQTIWVRHMSMGPGACNVTVTCSVGGAKTVNALPGVWSEWLPLCTTTAALSVTVSDQVNCNTGIRSQVRYFR